MVCIRLTTRWLPGRRATSALLAATLLTFTAPWTAAAAVPGSAAVHGSLRTAVGGAVADGDYKLTFRLYKASVAGAAVWTEGPVTVAVKGGAFVHSLGSTKGLAPSILGELAGGWLGVTVAAEPELPRKALRATLWAHRAAAAAQVRTPPQRHRDLVPPPFALLPVGLTG